MSKNSFVNNFINLATIVLLIGCSTKPAFEIEGNFTVNDPTPIYLYELLENESQLTDSVSMSGQNFYLSGNIEHPGIYRLEFFNDQEIYLVLHPGDKIRLTIDNLYTDISYYVENSPESKRIKTIMDRQHYVLRQIDELSREWEQNRTDSLIRQKIDSSYYALMRDHKKYTLDFIYEQPNSLANILAIYQNFGRRHQELFDRYDDLSVFSFVDSCLVGKYPGTSAVIALNKEVNETKYQIAHKQYVEKIVEAGRSLPAFSYPDIRGDSIWINNNTNQPGILLFWASWNPYSVEALKYLDQLADKKPYDKLKVVTISLDSDSMYLHNFLLKENIRLPVVCDYQYWDSDIVGKYAVKQIPSTIISNEQGVIIAKDVFADELLNHLKELVK